MKRYTTHQEIIEDLELIKIEMRHDKNRTHEYVAHESIRMLKKIDNENRYLKAENEVMKRLLKINT